MRKFLLFFLIILFLASCDTSPKATSSDCNDNSQNENNQNSSDETNADNADSEGNNSNSSRNSSSSDSSNSNSSNNNSNTNNSNTNNSNTNNSNTNSSNNSSNSNSSNSNSSNSNSSNSNSSNSNSSNNNSSNNNSSNNNNSNTNNSNNNSSNNNSSNNNSSNSNNSNNNSSNNNSSNSNSSNSNSSNTNNSNTNSSNSNSSNSNSSNNNSSNNNSSSEAPRPPVEKIVNRKDVPNPKISQEIIAHYRSLQALDYGIVYYAIEAPGVSNPIIPLGEYNHTIPQFEETIKNSGLFLFQTSRRVLSYQSDNEAFVIDFQQGVVTRELDGVERYVLQMRRANNKTDFTQWNLNDTDIKALNLHLKSLGYEPIKQGQTIKVHFIIRSSSTTHAQIHNISLAGTFAYVVK